MSAEIIAVTGNPKPQSRTHRLATTLAGAIAEQLGAPAPSELDLATFGGRVLDFADAEVKAATEQVKAADVIVVASPTYKATYSGLLKSFLDWFGAGSLAHASAVPILLGGAPNHLLAVDVHFTPLLLELGASVPARGLFVLESDVDAFDGFAREWAAAHAARLVTRPVAAR